MPELKVAVIPVTPFQQNCSLVWDGETMGGCVVDPGGDVDQILAAIAHYKVKAEAILLTHGHLDHVGGAADLAEALKITRIEGPHRADEALIAHVEAQAERFGVAGLKGVQPTRWLDEGDAVAVGALTFAVRHVPGHAPGHVVFINHENGFALVGDTLFQDSIGRTDLPGGDHALLIASIREKLLTLPDETTILPGHGAATTIGREKAMNSFLA